MEISVTYKEVAWIFVIDEYNYISEQKETGPTYDSGGEPGFPESVEINEYHLELCPQEYNECLIHMINNQLLENDKLCNHIFTLHNNSIHDELLEMHLREV